MVINFANKTGTLSAINVFNNISVNEKGNLMEKQTSCSNSKNPMEQTRLLQKFFQLKEIKLEQIFDWRKYGGWLYYGKKQCL